MYSVQCSETFISMSTVYSAVILLLVCVQCRVQGETVVGMCTMYSAVRLLLVCVQCTLQ